MITDAFLARSYVLAAATLLWFVGLTVHAAAGAIVVTTTASVLNGDISSPAALLAAPGPDGISLPEAVAAANNASQPQAITFAETLRGGTIVLTTHLLLTRDGTTLTGLTTTAGEPDLTLDGREEHTTNGDLYVLASDVIVRGLRFVGQDLDVLSVLVGIDPNSTPGRLDQPQPRQQVRNILIENNVFGDANGTPARGSAVRIYMEPTGKSVDASIETVRVRGNTFLHSAGDVGVNVGSNGFNCRIRDVVIEDNTFVRVRMPIAVESGHGADSQVIGTRILHNTFVNSGDERPLAILNLVDPPPATGNSTSRAVIDSTIVDGNSFSDGYIAIAGGSEDTTDCVVSNFEFVNNVMTSGWIAIGGDGNNRIDGLRFTNNTLMAGIGVESASNGRGAEIITGLSFRNTIFGPEASMEGVPPETVSYSLVNVSGFTGNGNISGDPRFVDPAQGDFHLRSDSPAIDAGTANGAPESDIECGPRMGLRDMGAYEFGAPAVARLFVSIIPGTGEVDLSPPGFACGSARSFAPGTVVTLTARPSPRWRLIKWGGDPDCSDGTVTMSADLRCEAIFESVPFRVRRRLDR